MVMVMVMVMAMMMKMKMKMKTMMVMMHVMIGRPINDRFCTSPQSLGWVTTEVPLPRGPTSGWGREFTAGNPAVASSRRVILLLWLACGHTWPGPLPVDIRTRLRVPVSAVSGSCELRNLRSAALGLSCCDLSQEFRGHCRNCALCRTYIPWALRWN